MPFVKSAIYGVQIILTGFPKGDSPQSGEMSRRDKGDGRPLGDSPQSGEMSRRDKGDGDHWEIPYSAGKCPAGTKGLGRGAETESLFKLLALFKAAPHNLCAVLFL